MTLKITDDTGVLDHDLQELAQRRFHFALSRFDSRIESVTVTVQQLGAASFQAANPIQQYRLDVLVRLSRSEDVFVAAEHCELSSCIVHAANMTGRAVSRSIDVAQKRKGAPPVSLAGTGSLVKPLASDRIGARAR